MIEKMTSEHVLQFIKYGCVGVINTLLTLSIIYLCKSLLGVNPWLSNTIGYTAGMLNSFFWNKMWVFHSHGTKLFHEMAIFFSGFAVCYLLQFFVTWLITLYIGEFERSLFGVTISGYGVATIIGTIFYTLANFLYNRLITFKQEKSSKKVPKIFGQSKNNP